MTDQGKVSWRSGDDTTPGLQPEPYVYPELAIYEAVMDKLLEDPRLEEAFFGLPPTKTRKR